MDTVVALVTDLRSPVLYALIVAVVFSETAILLGMFLPGETAAIVAGVLAGQHQLSLQLVVPLLVLAAWAGDSTGYLLGRRFGPALLEGRLLRRRRVQIDRAGATLRRRGWLVVVVSRFLPFLRTVTPGAAGVSLMPYPTFLAASFAGCLLWGVGCPVLGYFAADQYHRVEEVMGNTGIVVVALILVVAWAVRLRRRRAAHRATTDEEPTPHADDVYDPGSVGPVSPAGSVGIVRPRRRTDPRRP
ncbi:DedA family protein [Cryptosporangium phraense]|uniref:DedA family protein n=1 Tax=Cryptosporangium phraense TaxID=2593070 RepID=A0A545APK1_9ACTN|nr:DedA family protein [Cryptosporangium phraense]TQS43236.1 DedA family protein [Cryptosporangium phraense]